MKFEIPQSVYDFMDKINEKAKDHPEWLHTFNESFTDTLENTVRVLEDDTVFVLTGDIPAMWLRDSTAQMRPYLFLVNESPEIKKLLRGFMEKQLQYINVDPYANAFNKSEDNAGHQDDHTDMQPIIWERKYEIDSLAYPMQFTYLYYKETNETDHFNETFHQAVDKILEVFEVEQNHEDSPYLFERDTWRHQDTLENDGKGSPVGYTGMTWCGFRPSDDRCVYHYLVPSNMFASVVLGYLAEIYTDVFSDEEKVERIKKLQKEINKGIEEHAIVKNQAGEDVYAYEVDGLGNYLIMDDANIPSLLSMPYLGYTTSDDELYLNTRKTLLSDENPFYFSGEVASGIGSEHTPDEYIWHMAIAMEGLTTTDKEFKKDVLNRLVQTTGGTGVMHEGFHKDDSTKYTREWFSWPNMLFCELMLDYYGYRLKGGHYD